MKSRDFDLILIESLSHETKQSFFAENRESFNCNPDEYSKGLMDSFKRLSKETHETDYTRCNITKPNGDVAIGTINNADGEYILSKIGKVSYPDKKIIYIDTPEAYCRLTAEMMDNLWPCLNTYLQSINAESIAPSPLRTLKANCNTDQLRTIRMRLISNKVIGDITEKDFLYVFTNQQQINGINALKWKISHKLGHEFLKRLVYKDRQFDFGQINACIKYADGKKLDSNDKSTAQYKNDTVLNPILKF